MTYRVRLRPHAEKELLALPVGVRRRLIARLEALADDPRPHGSWPLKGRLRAYRRMRVGNYRVCYTITEKARQVTVVEVGHRSRVYDDLGRVS